MSANTPAPEAKAEAPQRAAVEGHGNSPAAWTMVLVALLGAMVGCIGFMIPNLVVFLVGAAIVVIGLILGVVLRAAGFGVGGSKLKEKAHGGRH